MLGPMPVRPPVNLFPPAHQISRAARCLRRLLAWIGAPPSERRNAAVASVVNDLLEQDPAAVYAAMRRVALASVPTDLLQDRYQLTRRETEVARLLAMGKSNADIARQLSISEHTCRRHTEQVLAKLGVRSRAAVAPLLAEAALDPALAP